jgi:hypothetical protein
MYCEEIGSWGKLWQQQRRALGRKGDFAVHARPGSRRHSTSKREEKEEEKKRLVLARAGLSSYLYRATCHARVPVYARGGIHPTTIALKILKLCLVNMPMTHIPKRRLSKHI